MTFCTSQHFFEGLFVFRYIFSKDFLFSKPIFHLALHPVVGRVASKEAFLWAFENVGSGHELDARSSGVAQFGLQVKVLAIEVVNFLVDRDSTSKIIVQYLFFLNKIKKEEPGKSGSLWLRVIINSTVR